MGFKTCVFLFIVIFQVTYGQLKPNFFRKDYTYLEASQGFYKIHTLHNNWQEAKKKCEREGASLFYPETKAEQDTVLQFWRRTQPFYRVFIGISDLLAKGVFQTIDGLPATDIYANWGPGEPNNADGVEDCVVLRGDGTLNDDKCDKNHPFICKKSLASLDWNLLCDIPDKSYVYHESLGKCYKFHLKPLNWTDAYNVCNDEQSYLAVINSQAEADHLVTERATKDKVKSKYLAGVVHLGFHNRFGDEWQSIKGTSLSDLGYDKWADKQPDGGERELCGAMSYNGLLNDIGCDQKCFFICEHDIGSLSNSINDRLGQ